MEFPVEYINQCKKAIEIQAEWRPCIGDCCINIKTNELLLVSYETTPGFLTCYSNKILRPAPQYVFLPRQDQLQDMVFPDTESFYIVHALSSFAGGQYGEEKGVGPGHYFPTMEQLWLAFVMKEKYNKIWNGEDWV